MKKDRNTFFQESGFMNQTGYQPYGTASYSNQSYYAGPIPNGMPQNFNPSFNQNLNQNQNYDYNDFESRLSKLERQYNRLDTRLTKLESSTLYSTDDIENNTNVYMV